MVWWFKWFYTAWNPRFEPYLYHYNAIKCEKTATEVNPISSEEQNRALLIVEIQSENNSIYNHSTYLIILEYVYLQEMFPNASVPNWLIQSQIQNRKRNETGNLTFSLWPSSQ